MSHASPNWIFLLLLMGVVIGVIAIFGALFSNRHTRGFATALLVIGAMFVGVVVLWMFNAQRSYVAADHRRAFMQQQDAIAEAKWAEAHKLRIQAQNQRSHSPQEIEQIQELERLANMAVEEGNNISVNGVPYAQAEATRAKVGLMAIGFPILMIVGLGVVFVAFRHGGPMVGLGVIALPLLFMSYAWLSFDQPSAVPDAVEIDSVHSIDQAWDHATATKIQLAESEDSTQNTEGVDASVESVAEAEPSTSSAADAPAAEIAHASDHATTSSDDPATSPPQVPILTENPTVQIADSGGAKPDWTEGPSKRVGNVYRRVLQAGPYATVGECQTRIDPEIEQVVLQYTRDLVKAESRGHGYARSLESLGISPQFIRENIVAEEYYETVSSSVNDNMKTLWVLLEFDPRDNEYLLEGWRQSER